MGAISSKLGESAAEWEKHYRSAAEELSRIGTGELSVSIFANLSVSYFNAGMRREAADSSLKVFSLLDKYETNKNLFKSRESAF